MGSIKPVASELDVGSAASVRVPATSANLGPGFDSLGLALALWDDVHVEVTAGGLAFDVAGEGAQAVPRDDTHLIIRALRAALLRMSFTAPGLSLRSTNRIPHGRGLGSSAAAICAGILVARELVRQQDDAARFTDPLDDEAVLALAGELEGHPDNVAACLLGGATLAWTDGQNAPTTAGAAPTSARAIRLDLRSTIAAVIFIPPFKSSTHVARGLLPELISHADASANAARSGLLVAALTSFPELLLTATEDRLHQRYRASAMPESAALMTALREGGIAATMSGAGPTVLVLLTGDEDQARALSYAPAGWRSAAVTVDTIGALGASIR